jgi:hypothetical protein
VVCRLQSAEMVRSSVDGGGGLVRGGEDQFDGLGAGVFPAGGGFLRFGEVLRVRTLRWIAMLWRGPLGKVLLACSRKLLDIFEERLV